MKTLKWTGLITRIGVLALVVALVALAAVACGSDADTPDADISGAGTTVTSTDDSTVTSADGTGAATSSLLLTEADSNKSFTVSVGDTVTVVLAGNMTTGYQWALALAEGAADLLEPADDQPAYVPDSVAEGVVGSGGKYTFVFTAAAAGQVELRLKYWRSFEPQAEPVQTFTANITIE
jgi:inhibitor of cysteine peptidase